MIFSQEKAFDRFRKEHPHLRFYEALQQFTGADRILLEYDGKQHDTVYWQDLKLIKPKMTPSQAGKKAADARWYNDL